jgi:hypothetical protein
LLSPAWETFPTFNLIVEARTKWLHLPRKFLTAKAAKIAKQGKKDW